MAKFTKKQLDYYGRFIPEMLDVIAATVKAGAPSVAGVPNDEAIKNIAKALRDSASKEA